MGCAYKVQALKHYSGEGAGGRVMRCGSWQSPDSFKIRDLKPHNQIALRLALREMLATIRSVEQRQPSVVRALSGWALSASDKVPADLGKSRHDCTCFHALRAAQVLGAWQRELEARCARV